MTLSITILCHDAECRYAEGHYTECHGAFTNGNLTKTILASMPV